MMMALLTVKKSLSMKQISIFIGCLFFVSSAFAQEKLFGLNLTPGVSFFYVTKNDGTVLKDNYAAMFSPGFDINYTQKRNSLSFGLSVGLEIIRDNYSMKIDSFSIMDSNMNVSSIYGGLKYNNLYSQYRFHVSPMIRWTFLQKEKVGFFLELQPGIIHNMLMQEHISMDYQANFEDSDTTYSTWYSNDSHFRFLSFSLSGKLGFQFQINEKLSFNVAAFYRNYLSTFIKKDYSTDYSFVYYKYGLETGLKFNLD